MVIIVRDEMRDLSSHLYKILLCKFSRTIENLHGHLSR